jgi:hypothetical protein
MFVARVSIAVARYKKMVAIAVTQSPTSTGAATADGGQQDARQSVPGLERRDMPAQKALHARVEEELQNTCRDQDRTSTKAMSGRRARPICKWPKCPQSTCPISFW